MAATHLRGWISNKRYARGQRRSKQADGVIAGSSTRVSGPYVERGFMPRGQERLFARGCLSSRVRRRRGVTNTPNTVGQTLLSVRLSPPGYIFTPAASRSSGRG